jgi:hypothetical protein
MSEPETVVVVLEVERGSDPVTGRLRAGPHAPRAFTGWLELTAALADAFAEPAPNRQGA